MPADIAAGCPRCGTAVVAHEASSPQAPSLAVCPVDPHYYHWDTLFVKGKEMWRGAGTKPDALRQIKHVRKGDRVLCYHNAPDRSLYAIAEVTPDPYFDPHDATGKDQEVHRYAAPWSTGSEGRRVHLSA